MEKIYKRVPFDIELAKKIQSGEVEGRIVQNNGLPATILAFDINGENLAVRFMRKDGTEGVDEHQPNGKVLAEWCSGSEEFALVIELPEETPQTFHTEFPKGHAVLHGNTIICIKEETPNNEFKPFDKVLVRDTDKDAWRPRLYSRKGRVGYCMQDNYEYMQILPYEGNEHLVGTTDKPK